MRLKFQARLRVADVRVDLTTRPRAVEVKAALVDEESGATFAWAVPMRALSPDAQARFDAFIAQVEADVASAWFASEGAPREGGIRTPEEAEKSPGGLGEFFAGDGVPPA